MVFLKRTLGLFFKFAREVEHLASCLCACKVQRDVKQADTRVCFSASLLGNNCMYILALKNESREQVMPF